MNIGHIEGGTHAGWRKLKAAHAAWSCPSCKADNPGYRNQCGCGEARPYKSDRKEL